MLKSSICDYSHVYILVKGTITVVGQGANDAAIATDRNDKEENFKNCAAFIGCISKINKAQIDNAKDLDIVMPMYSFIE